MWRTRRSKVLLPSRFDSTSHSPPLDSAKNDISLWFGKIVENLSEGSWSTTRFIQSYPDTSGRGLNKVTANILVTLFLDKRKTLKGESLSVTYMYILGVGGIGILTRVFTNFDLRCFSKKVPPNWSSRTAFIKNSAKTSSQISEMLVVWF